MKRQKKTTRPRAVPEGLVTMMSLLREEDWTNIAAEAHARRAHVIARRVIRSTRIKGGALDLALKGVVNEMYPGIGGGDTGSGLSAGFYVGAATAWLLLRSVNGGAR